LGWKRKSVLGLDNGKQSELNVSEIAYEVGFADPSYFSRMFQKEFGRNPIQFLTD
jgi:AraC-like DNA-binding protein